MPPSLRDPQVAAREWREQGNAESGHRKNGKVRIRRPGVVFDVVDNAPEDRPRYRSNRRREKS